MSSPSWRTTCCGGTTCPATRLSVMSSRPEMNVGSRRCPRPATPSRSASRVGQPVLATKPPLAPVGTMTAFLTICALTSPRISVRKSSRRSRPAQPAAGDLAEAQVHALDPGRVDPDLEHRPRRRQVGHRLRVELEGDVRLETRCRGGLTAPAPRRRAGRSWCAASRGSPRGTRAQDPVLVQAARRRRGRP